MSTFSEVQQPIICWNCKALVTVPEDQLRSASCDSCGSGLSPAGRMIPVSSFLDEQRKLREVSSAGPLSDPEIDFLREHLSEATDVGGRPLAERVTRFEGGFGELKQTKTAVWIAAIVILINSGLPFLFAAIEGSTDWLEGELLGSRQSLLVPLAIDVVLAVNLLRGKGWARTWTLIRVALGVLVFGGISIAQGTYLDLVWYIGFGGGVLVLLTGTSTGRRITGGVALLASVIVIPMAWTFAGTVADSEVTGVPAMSDSASIVTYSRFGITFDYPASYTMLEGGVFEAEPTASSGTVTVGLEGIDVSRALNVAWFGSVSPTDPALMLEGGLEGMENEGITVERGDRGESSLLGDPVLYQFFRVSHSDLPKGARGVVAATYLNSCQRGVGVSYMDSVAVSDEEVLAEFQSYLDTFECR